MKHYLVILTILISGFSANSQTYEIGGMIGGANYIGDAGRESYIYPTKMVFGGIIKYNRSPRHSYRASLLFGQIEAKDSQSSSSRRNQRDYSFVNSIKEFSLGMEYTFWEFNVHSGKKIATPYLFTGFAVFAYDDLYQEKEGDTKMKSYHSNSISYAIPMAIGYKAKISQNLMLGLELGVRYTFTDNIDGSNPGKDSPAGDRRSFGNPNSNDWYVFSGATLTFAFGRKPCNSIY